MERLRLIPEGRCGVKPKPDLVPIDDRARDGGFKLIGDGEHFAVARWKDGAWEFGSGRPLDFEPTGYAEGKRP